MQLKEKDVLGLPLDEGIKLLNDYNITISKTYGLNKKFNQNLSEPRILKVLFTDNSVNLVVGYF